jgi:arginine:ornithine antiporter / lysine permease
VRSAVATVYATAMIFAGGKFLLLSALLYAPGTVLYVLSRREQKKAVFTGAEGVIFGAILVAAVAGLYGLVSGSISV